MAKNLYDHCTVETQIDKENNTVTVAVAFKDHALGLSERLRYTVHDVKDALCRKGTPVETVLSGQQEVLVNKSIRYLSGEYSFSLIGEEPSPQSKTRRKPTSKAKPKTTTKDA